MAACLTQAEETIDPLASYVISTQSNVSVIIFSKIRGDNLEVITVHIFT